MYSRVYEGGESNNQRRRAASRARHVAKQGGDGTPEPIEDQALSSKVQVGDQPPSPVLEVREPNQIPFGGDSHSPDGTGHPGHNID